MKKWAVLTVIVYLIILAVLTLPVVLIAFGRWWLPEGAGTTLLQALEVYTETGYWIWLGVMGIGEFLLLLVPVNLVSERPKARRSLLTPLLTTAFFLANISLAAVVSLLCLMQKEKGFDAFGFLGEVTWNDPLRNAAGELILANLPFVGKAGLSYILGMITAISGLWFLWGIIFYYFSRASEPDDLMRRSVRWLLGGSILELLIAVPSHIIVRNRSDCCAPLGTFWGITTGLSIMFLCFGPGVFFLFVERFGRLQPEPKVKQFTDNGALKRG